MWHIAPVNIRSILTRDRQRKAGAFVVVLAVHVGLFAVMARTAASPPMALPTVIGAAYITVVCVVPEWIIANYGAGLAVGGTSSLIVVSVTMDTVAQIQSHLLAHQYDGLIKKS